MVLKNFLEYTDKVPQYRTSKLTKNTHFICQVLTCQKKKVKNRLN